MSKYLRYYVQIEIRGEKEPHQWRKIVQTKRRFYDEELARLIYCILEQRLTIAEGNQEKLAELLIKNKKTAADK